MSTSKHFWLSPEQQAIMDGATATASEYGHIGLFSVGKAWKRHVAAMVGSAVDPADYLRAHNVTGAVRFGGWWDHWHRRAEPIQEVRALIRLKPQQAMMMKLRHAGSDEAWIADDETGESWGNMLIAQNDRPTYRRYSETFDRNWTRGGIRNLLADRPFGPTLAAVGDHLAGLPRSWAAALVWYRAHEWHDAADPVEVANYEISRSEARLAVVRDAFELPVETQGEVWARDWWESCQPDQYRLRYGISDDDMTPLVKAVRS